MNGDRTREVIVADLVMPGLDGTKLIETIKAQSPQTPAILVSGKVRMPLHDTHADVFFPKGMYAPAELLERIRLLLVRKRGPKRLQERRALAVNYQCIHLTVIIIVTDSQPAPDDRPL